MLRMTGSGWRHFLLGEPVHCGSQLEMQAVEWRWGDDDDNPYAVDRDEWLTVRYEASVWRHDPSDIRVSLYADVGGYSATVEYHPRMRFRWPGRAS